MTTLDATPDDRYEISYGKRRVPVYRTFAAPLTGVPPIPESRFTGRTNALMAAEIDLEVFGNDFLPAYTVADNSNVVATDSMKNIILRQALDYAGATWEGYLAALGRAFIGRYEHVHEIGLEVRELPFAAAPVPANDGGIVESDVLYDASGRSDTAIARLRMERTADGGAIVDHECGLVGIRAQKIIGSAFTAFVRDEFTTLPERRDRPLYIHLDTHWTYLDIADAVAGNGRRYVPAEQVRDLLLAVFHEFVSESIQHLVHEMATRMLERFPQLAEIRLRAENRTRDPFHTSETDPAVKVYSDPFPAFGEITLRMRREAT